MFLEKYKQFEYEKMQVSVMIFKFSFAWRILFLYKTEIKYQKKRLYSILEV